MNSLFNISFYISYLINLLFSILVFLYFIFDLKDALHHGVISDITITTLCFICSTIVLVGALAAGVLFVELA